MARTGTDGIFNSPRTTSFTRDIYPILQRADHLSGVHGTAHANGVLRPLSDAARIAAFGDPSQRAKVLSKLAPIGTDAPGPQQLPPGQMPQLYSGANPDPDGPIWTYLALTKYQMAHMQNWVHGNFDADWIGSAPTPIQFEQIPVARQAWALCEAALEACVGGSFYPGLRAHMTSHEWRRIIPSRISAGNFASIQPTRRASLPKRWPFPGRRISQTVQTIGGRRSAPTM